MVNVLVSGSFPHDSIDPRQEALVGRVSHAVGERIVSRGFTLVSGVGMTVGSKAIEGAKCAVLDDTLRDKHITARPFPFQQAPREEEERKTFFAEHREELISLADIAIFISGTKVVDERLVDAAGVQAEFDLCSGKHIPVIPIGATAGISALLWKLVSKDYDNYLPGTTRSLFARLDKLSGVAEPSDLQISGLVDDIFSLVDQLIARRK